MLDFLIYAVIYAAGYVVGRFGLGGLWDWMEAKARSMRGQ